MFFGARDLPQPKDKCVFDSGSRCLHDLDFSTCMKLLVGWQTDRRALLISYKLSVGPLADIITERCHCVPDVPSSYCNKRYSSSGLITKEWEKHKIVLGGRTTVPRWKNYILLFIQNVTWFSLVINVVHCCQKLK